MTSALAGEIAQWHREAERALNRREYTHAHSLCVRILASQPDFADAFFLLGMIAAEHANYGKALEVIDRALALAPSRADYRAQRGRCLIALQRPREAFEAARSALDSKPTDALTLDTIGVVMTRAGAHAEALPAFRRAVDLAPSNAAYRYNLGASLQFIGELGEAELEYRRAIALDPQSHKAWSSLAQVTTAQFSSDEIASLEQWLARTSDADIALHVGHALAKQAEDRGEYALAFEHLSHAKARKRQALDYSFELDRELFDAASTTWSMASPHSGCPSHEPIFIVGMPRTGTTLVERIISSHPDVYSAGELTNFGLMVKRATSTRSNRTLDAETLLAAIDTEASALGAAYIDSTRPRTGHTAHFIDKMPLNFFYAALIRRALPNAKIIALRRNPLDTCLSNYRQLFATSFSYYNYAYDLRDTAQYYLHFAKLSERWRSLLGDNYLEVHYEHVVDDTEREARRLIGFCELPWDPACLNFERNAAPVATASSAQVRRPIYRTALERWRKYERELEPARAVLRAGGIPGV